jgi:hypothetical protein
VARTAWPCSTAAAKRVVGEQPWVKDMAEGDEGREERRFGDGAGAGAGAASFII